MEGRRENRKKVGRKEKTVLSKGGAIGNKERLGGEQEKKGKSA